MQRTPEILLWCSTLVIAAASTVWLGSRITSARDALRALQQAQRELLTVAASDPAPTPEVAARLEAELARAAGRLHALRSESVSKDQRSSWGATAPKDSAEAFFDLARFAERMRERVQCAGTKTSVDERFGFAAYRRAGPAAEAIPGVFRQRQIIEHLCDCLCRARPHELIFVKRELAPAERVPSRPFGGNRPDIDVIEIESDPVRRPQSAGGLVGAMRFQVAFTGDTAVLRTFLNALAASELLLIVREVNVESSSGAPENAFAAIPATLVNRSPSRFTVTVDHVMVSAAEEVAI